MNKIKLSRLFNKNQSHTLIGYMLISLILLNSIINIFQDKKLNIFFEMNFFDIIAGLLLFAFLLNFGILINHLDKTGIKFTYLPSYYRKINNLYFDYNQ